MLLHNIVTLNPEDNASGSSVVYVFASDGVAIVSGEFYVDVIAVNDVSIEICDREFLVMLGPSGCGKTTILKMITGLINPDEGDILLDGKSILSIPTEKRNIVMVFQNYLLFPYMTVNENVGFALKMKGIDNKEIEIKVKQMLELVKLPDVGNRKPCLLYTSPSPRD